VGAGEAGVGVGEGDRSRRGGQRVEEGGGL
jgi:hypothetical protein